MATSRRSTDKELLTALVEDEPVLKRFLETATGGSVYLVGGSIRDALLGVPGAGFDLDLAFDGPVADLARRLDPEAELHERFDTAELHVDGRAIDIARTRSEHYPHPGALPVVKPAAIEQDLQRRDFSINALALRVDRPDELIDLCGGRSDLERGLLRVLHEQSFSDDPTRALRAARYSARLDLDLEVKTANLLRRADLSQVSQERIDNELRLIADEPCAIEALRLIDAWGLIRFAEDRLDLTAAALELAGVSGWEELSDRRRVVLASVHGPGPRDVADLLTRPDSASTAVAVASGRSTTDLVIARAAGATWLDQWLDEWRGIEPEIDGDDLIRAGIPTGPAIGAGLKAALQARLDRGLEDPEAQLEVAVATARQYLESTSRP